MRSGTAFPVTDDITFQAYGLMKALGIRSCSESNPQHAARRGFYSKMELINSSILFWMEASSVTAQLTAT